MRKRIHKVAAQKAIEDQLARELLEQITNPKKKQAEEERLKDNS